MIYEIVSKVNTVWCGFKRVIWSIPIKLLAKECGNSLCVSFYSKINNNTYLGHHVNFNGMRINGNGVVTIGNYFHSGKNCQIISENHNYEGEAIPYDDTLIAKSVIIEDCVWLGNNVIILGGVTIGEGAIIQAGSVVVSNIPPMAIAGGHPAKVFKYRDVAHYNRMKELGKFH